MIQHPFLKDQTTDKSGNASSKAKFQRNGSQKKFGGGDSKNGINSSKSIGLPGGIKKSNSKNKIKKIINPEKQMSNICVNKGVKKN